MWYEHFCQVSIYVHSSEIICPKMLTIILILVAPIFQMSWNDFHESWQPCILEYLSTIFPESIGTLISRSQRYTA